MASSSGPLTRPAGTSYSSEEERLSGRQMVEPPTAAISSGPREWKSEPMLMDSWAHKD